MKFLFFTFLLCATILLKASQPVFINDGQSPMISEFMALNKNAFLDNKNRYSDWIEIYNPTSKVINMQGWFVSDDESKLFKWRFPELLLQPGQYKVLFMSGDNDISDPANLHVGFSLKSGGETLILTKPDGATKVWYFNGKFPQQYNNVSYGIIGSDYKYLGTSTPGTENKGDLFLPPLSFSSPHGFYSSNFKLDIKSVENNVSIYYTLNGSDPDSVNGLKYVSPLNISKTTVIRAVAYKKGFRKTETASSTYLFTKDILKQPALPTGYPTQWGPFVEMKGNGIGDYEMDPEICDDPVNASKIEQALKELPVVSIVTDIDYLFSSSTDPDRGGIYYHTGAPISNTTYQLGKDWERPASIEYIEPNGEGFNINCGIKINGGHSRRNEKSPKHSFRLLFKNEYGPSKLEYDIFKEQEAVKTFNRLILRAGYGFTWIHFDTNQRKQAQYIFDSWSKDAFRSMGHVAAHNKFVHLFINGLYWGMYNICERMDEDFMASYFKGKSDDFDVIKDYTELVNGDLIAWRDLNKQINNQISLTENYQKLIGNNPDGTRNQTYPIMVDPKNLIDYMLLNFYGGNNDWDHHNWVSSRNKNNPEGFKFFPWDTELIFGGLNNNVTNKYNANCPSAVFQGLLPNNDFKMLLADRIYKHFFNNGIFTPEKAVELYMLRANEIKNSMVCESARWGDYRRDVHQWGSSPFNLYTVNDWELALENLLDNYFPKRTDVVVDQLIKAGYYPSVEPPIIDTSKTILAKGDKITINSKTSLVYYTLDGTDPRLPGGALSKSAKIYSKTNGIIAQNSCVVVTRTKVGDQWSAKDEAFFFVPGTVSYTELASNNNGFKFNAYPNPAKNKVVFQYSGEESDYGKIEIFSSMGKRIATIDTSFNNENNGQIEFDTSVLPKGVYLCTFNTNSGVKSLKLLVSGNQ